MVFINAINCDELIQTLRQTDISVPPRTDGRKTEHCERWSICRFLATFAHTDLIGFPLSIDHRDRPDFLMNVGSSTIGVEITEAVSENAAATDAYREHNGIDGPFPMVRHHPEEDRLRGSELAEAASTREFGPAWAGNASEREWVEAMRAFIRRKVDKSDKPGFDKYSKNWLLIYDCWSVPALDRDLATKMLFDSLTETDFGQFHAVFIESSNFIWAFRPETYEAFPINDLWYDS